MSVDYEVALRNAVVNVCYNPEGLASGGSIKQALWKQLQSEGFAVDNSLDGSPT